MTKTFIHHSLFTLGVVAVGAALLSFSAILAHAASAPSIVTTIHNGSHGVITQVLPGTQVHANVNISSTTSATLPTGTVNFNLYSNLTCSGVATVQSGVALSNGVVESGTTTLTASGLSYNVFYNGDASTTAATSTCAALATSTPPVATTTPGTISGNIWNDQNGNDVKNAGEPNLSGWTVWLHQGANDSTPVIKTAVTDSNGNYSFSGLAFGTYFVEQQEQNGWIQTSDDMKVVLNANTPTGIVNFSDMQKSATSTDNGKGHGFGHFKKFKNGHDNGNHKGQYKNGDNEEDSD